MSGAAIELFRLKRIEIEFRLTGSIAIAFECRDRLRAHAASIIAGGCN